MVHLLSFCFGYLSVNRTRICESLLMVWEEAHERTTSRVPKKMFQGPSVWECIPLVNLGTRARSFCKGSNPFSFCKKIERSAPSFWCEAGVFSSVLPPDARRTLLFSVLFCFCLLSVLFLTYETDVICDRLKAWLLWLWYWITYRILEIVL